MSFDWREYVELALVLAGREGRVTPEARLRTAISRAYYGAFSSSREFAEMADFFRPGNSGRDHSDLRQAYAARPDETSRRIAENLQRLHQKRKRCDYESVVRSPEAECQRAIQLAQNIQEDLSELRKLMLQ